LKVERKEEDKHTASIEPVKINEMVVECPICRRPTLKIEDYLYDMPLVGKVILTSGKCSTCGYRFTDVRLAEAQGPRRIVFRVEKPDDVNVLVVKASTAAVIIPELKLKMIPGPAATGFITTIEGVLERFLEALEAACSSPDANQEACRKAKEMITAAKEGKIKYTVVIVDPEGVSAILSDKAIVEQISAEEAEKLIEELGE
jgi:zinc finger protein